MWNFYDELCTGIPSGIRIEGCIVGKLWTVVRANGNTGVARTLGAPEDGLGELGRSMIGLFLRDAANAMRWDSLVRASIGVAALNAFYNTAARLEKLNAPPVFQNDLSGRRAAIIGELPDLEAGLKACCALTVLPLPEGGEVGGEYAAALTGDHVFISGDALTNQTLPALLAKVGADTKVTLAGVSVPAAPVLFAFDDPLHGLSGVYARFGATVEGAALHDIPDLTPGVLPFSVSPVQLRYLHERPEVARYASSPYQASAFNCAFNPWKGMDYDRSAWSPIYRG